MKKVLALVLAVMMMATVAFAADIGNDGTLGDGKRNEKDPGASITIGATAFQNSDDDVLGTKLRPGDFSSENFTVTTKRFEKGGNLVKAVEFDDDDNVIKVKLNDDYDMKRTDTINLVIKEIKITAKRTINDNVKKNSKWTCDKTTVAADELDWSIGYALAEVKIAGDFDVRVTKDSGVESDTAEDTNGGNAETGGGKGRAVVPANPWSPLVKFIEGDASYGTANIDFEGVAYASGRVYKNETVFLKFDEDVNVDLVKKYPEADLSFVNFKGAPTFNSNMEVEIYADEDTYIYEVKDNKIAPCSLKWDEDSYAFTGKVRTLGAYVISDTKLSVETTAADGNPDTGANDVVGIATALAAVALVSAAAVSLKK